MHAVHTPSVAGLEIVCLSDAVSFFSVLSSELTNSLLKNGGEDSHRHIQALTAMNQNIVEIVEVSVVKCN